LVIWQQKDKKIFWVMGTIWGFSAIFYFRGSLLKAFLGSIINELHQFFFSKYVRLVGVSVDFLVRERTFAAILIFGLNFEVMPYF
jgi:hypothetical protein